MCFHESSGHTPPYSPPTHVTPTCCHVSVWAATLLRRKVLLSHLCVREATCGQCKSESALNSNQTHIVNASTCTPHPYASAAQIACVSMCACVYVCVCVCDSSSACSVQTHIAEGKPLQCADMYKWAKDIVRGLSYMHEMGRAHGDLKEANVLVDEHGTAKVRGCALQTRPYKHGLTYWHIIQSQCVELTSLCVCV